MRPRKLDRNLPLGVSGRCLGFLFLFGAGLMLHCTHAAMGKSWNPFITILPDQKLVMAFPFSMVRHPMYSSGLLMCLGFGLSTRSVTVLVGWALFCAALSARIPAEEAVLLGHFGSEYVNFMAAVPSRLIPGIL